MSPARFRSLILACVFVTPATFLPGCDPENAGSVGPLQGDALPADSSLGMPLAKRDHLRTNTQRQWWSGGTGVSSSSAPSSKTWSEP